MKFLKTILIILMVMYAETAYSQLILPYSDSYIAKIQLKVNGVDQNITSKLKVFLLGKDTVEYKINDGNVSIPKNKVNDLRKIYKGLLFVYEDCQIFFSKVDIGPLLFGYNVSWTVCVDKFPYKATISDIGKRYVSNHSENKQISYLKLESSRDMDFYLFGESGKCVK